MRKDWVYSRVFHEGGKIVILSVAISAFCGFLASFHWNRLHPLRWPLLYTSLCIALTSTVVGILKQCTNRYCPWDMLCYGGKVPYTTLLDGTPAPFTNGHGWPAGHAAPALALCCLYIVAQARDVKHPVRWLLPCVLIGGLFAWVQQVRGAHFVSHNLWSAMISWMIALCLARFFTGVGWHLGRQPNHVKSQRHPAQS